MKINTLALATITTGVMLTDIGTLTLACEALIGFRPYTHQFKRVIPSIAGHVEEALPQFPTKAMHDEIVGDKAQPFMLTLVETWGHEVEVPPMAHPPAELDPVLEAISIFGGANVSAVRPPAS